MWHLKWHHNTRDAIRDLSSDAFHAQPPHRASSPFHHPLLFISTPAFSSTWQAGTGAEPCFRSSSHLSPPQCLCIAGPQEQFLHARCVLQLESGEFSVLTQAAPHCHIWRHDTGPPLPVGFRRNVWGFESCPMSPWGCHSISLDFTKCYVLWDHAVTHEFCDSRQSFWPCLVFHLLTDMGLIFLDQFPSFILWENRMRSQVRKNSEWGGMNEVASMVWLQWVRDPEREGSPSFWRPTHQTQKHQEEALTLELAWWRGMVGRGRKWRQTGLEQH